MQPTPVASAHPARGKDNDAIALILLLPASMWHCRGTHRVLEPPAFPGELVFLTLPVRVAIIATDVARQNRAVVVQQRCRLPCATWGRLRNDRPSIPLPAWVICGIDCHGWTVLEWCIMEVRAEGEVVHIGWQVGGIIVIYICCQNVQP